MKNRVQRLRQVVPNYKIDGIIVNKLENVAYLSGFVGSSGTLLITEDAQYLLTDFRYLQQAVSQAPEFTIIDFMKEGLQKTLYQLCKKEAVNTVGFEAHFLTYNDVEKLQNEFEGIQVAPCTEVIETLRMIKDADEIEKIAKAENIGDQAFSYILTVMKEGMTEKEIALELEFYMKKLGATHLSFDSIVASGVNSSMPHAKPTDKKIAYGDFVKLDFGCIYDGYCSDMTRTVVIGEASDKHKEIYQIVLQAQLRAIDAVKPGITGKQVDKVARDYISSKGYGENFGHGLGHGVGRYIHENPRLAASSETVLEPGMVVTVEPGIYIPDFGGVRIEDVVVVTETGCRNLTSSPKELIVL